MRRGIAAVGGPPPGPRRLPLAGIAVHAYTACGSVLALLVVLAAIRGRVEAALWLGFAALIIDGTDGMLARRARVRETIPQFDGGMLDNIVDYLTYVFAPAVLLWTAGYLPDGAWGTIVAALPVLASCYQFCRVDAKTDDHFFRGFPSYWNVIALYVVVLDANSTVTGIVLAGCAVLVFVPIRYLYPSRTLAFRRLTLVLNIVWLATYAVLVAELPNPNLVVVAISFLYVAYYLSVSGYLTLRTSQEARPSGLPPSRALIRRRASTVPARHRC